METIRVGLIRCDLHAYWYAGLFAGHDPYLYRDAQPECYWLFYGSYHAQPRKLVVPTVAGFKLTKVWDADKAEAERMAEVFLGAPQVCTTVEEIYRDIDLLFIADCFGQGEDHLELAAPALRGGIPTFVDKPFAYNLRDAQAMVSLARETGTPLMSASLLGMSPHADRFRSRFAEIAPVRFGLVRGAIGKEGSLAGGIHVLALTQNLFGDEPEWVECMGEKPLEYLHLRYPGDEGLDVMAVSHYVDEPWTFCGYRAEVYGESGVIHSPYIGDFAFPYAGERIMKMLQEMVRTRKPQLGYEKMLGLIRLAEAGRLAQETRGKVCLADLPLCQERLAGSVCGGLGSRKTAGLTVGRSG